MADNETFRISGSTYLRILLSDKISGTKALATATVTVVLCIAIGFADVRYSLVGLMILLVILPGILAIIILSELLSPEAAKGTIPHTATIDNEKIMISYKGEENRSYKLPADEIILLSNITGMKFHGEYVVLETKGQKRGFLILPKEKERKLPEHVKERLSTFE